MTEDTPIARAASSPVRPANQNGRDQAGPDPFGSAAVARVSSAEAARQDLAERAEEAVDDVLAGEIIFLLQFDGRAVAAKDFRGGELRINYPHQGHTGLAIVAQFFLDRPGRVVGRDDLDGQVGRDLYPSLRRDIPGQPAVPDERDVRFADSTRAAGKHW